MARTPNDLDKEIRKGGFGRAVPTAKGGPLVPLWALPRVLKIDDPVSEALQKKFISGSLGKLHGTMEKVVCDETRHMCNSMAVRMMEQLIVDTSTKNTSFLELAEKHRKANRLTYYHLLGLQNPELVGVDPRSLNMENDPHWVKRNAVVEEVRNNPWYFIREIVIVPEVGGPGCVFHINEGNCAAISAYYNEATLYSVNSRQSGLSVSHMVLAIYHALSGRALEYTPVIVTPNETIARHSTEMCRRIWRMLPKYLVAGKRCPVVVSNVQDRENPLNTLAGSLVPFVTDAAIMKHLNSVLKHANKRFGLIGTFAPTRSTKQTRWLKSIYSSYPNYNDPSTVAFATGGMFGRFTCLDNGMTPEALDRTVERNGFSPALAAAEYMCVWPD